MWLSIIIPCYNAGNTISTTLDSIVNQDLEDYEVIICDDKSTDNTIAICHTYDDKLPLKYITTRPHGMHCPNNTRYDGFEAAQGEWITFIDHDDAFEPGIFTIVQNAIKENLQIDPNMEFTFISGECGLDHDGKIVEQFCAKDSVLMHGKFYYRDFLIKNDLTIQENIYIYEDIYFNNRILSYCVSHNLEMIFIDKMFYRWYLNPDSLSHWLEPYGQDFDLYYFSYWVHATVDPVFEMYEKYGNEQNKLTLLQSASQAFITFYFLYMVNLQIENLPQKMVQLRIKELLNRTLKIFKTNIIEIISLALSNGDLYNALRDSMIDSRRVSFIESKTFHQFMMDIYNEDYSSGMVVKVIPI